VSYRDDLAKALWHAKACIRCLRKAAASLNVDIDKPPQEPAPSEKLVQLRGWNGAQAPNR
jgi:hypothetical protein